MRAVVVCGAANLCWILRWVGGRETVEVCPPTCVWRLGVCVVGCCQGVMILVRCVLCTALPSCTGH
jgi:hypothetical protein